MTPDIPLYRSGSDQVRARAPGSRWPAAERGCYVALVLNEH
jgi:hypothetical protein